MKGQKWVVCNKEGKRKKIHKKKKKKKKKNFP